uniref:phosphopantetheine-binding protein n=1 Tax=Pseudozobellia sp. WGM2 TaxID=2787625 RepID=UPI001AE0385E
EKQLAAIWQEVLGREKIGIKDDFFELGGHSLNAALIKSRIDKKFNVKINFTDFFSNSNIEFVSIYIKSVKTINEPFHETEKDNSLIF